MNIERACALARHMKEAMGWADLSPRLHVVRPGDTPDDIGLLVGSGRVGDQVRAALSFYGDAAVEAVVLTTDGYCMVTGADGAGSVVRRGQLARAWAEGQRDGLSEALTVLVCRADGTYDGAILPYDATRREWAEEQGRDAMLGGDVIDALVDAVTHGRRRA